MAVQPLSHVTQKCGRQHSNSSASEPMHTDYRRIEGGGFHRFVPCNIGRRNAALNVFCTMQRNFCNPKKQKLSWQFLTKGVRTSLSKVRSETNVTHKLKKYLRSFATDSSENREFSESTKVCQARASRRGLACSVDGRFAVPLTRVR